MAKTRVRLSQAEEQYRSLKERLELSTAEIGLSVRTTNCLEEKGIFTVEDLLNTNRNELLSIQNFGEKTLEEVYLALEAIGFFRQGRDPNQAEPQFVEHANYLSPPDPMDTFESSGASATPSEFDPETGAYHHFDTFNSMNPPNRVEHSPSEFPHTGEVNRPADAEYPHRQPR